jgi:hypothetical protein
VPSATLQSIFLVLEALEHTALLNSDMVSFVILKRVWDHINQSGWDVRM